MPLFIELMRPKHGEIYLNIDHIISLLPIEDGTMIRMSDGVVTVTQKVHQILALIPEPSNVR